MDWLDLFKNALPVIVALLTVISAGVGIGFWLGRLSTHQRQTQDDLQRLRHQVDELQASRRDWNRDQSEMIQVNLRNMRRQRWDNAKLRIRVLTVSILGHAINHSTLSARIP